MIKDTEKSLFFKCQMIYYKIDIYDFPTLVYINKVYTCNVEHVEGCKL